MKKENFIKIDSKPVYVNKFITVNEKTYKLDGRSSNSQFYVMSFPNWVNIVPVTKKMTVILIKQFRFGIEDICLEIPGGMVDDNEDNYEEAAKRELLEETGYSVDNIQLLKKVSGNPAIQNNFVYGYLGTNVTLTSNQNLDENEDIEILEVPLEDIPNMIKNGEIHHPYASLSLILALNHFGIDMK